MSENKPVIVKRRMLTNEDVRHKNALEQIKHYYKSKRDITLDEEIEKIRIRIEGVYQIYLYDQNCKYSKNDTYREHSRIFGVHVSQSRRDLNTALELFPRIDVESRDTHRAVALSMTLDSHKLAQERGDLDNMIKSARLYSDITGLEKDDPNAPKVEDFKIPVIEVLDEFTRTLLEKIAEMGKQGNTLNLQELKVIDLIENIDFEVIDKMIQQDADDKRTNQE